MRPLLLATIVESCVRRRFPATPTGANRLVAASATALGFAAILAACDKPPTAPGPGRGGPDVPASFTRVELAGPASVPPGETAQFTATAFYTDGSSRDVSAKAAWRTGSPTVLSISTTGLALGHNPGETSVSVTFGGQTPNKVVMVIRPGTYRLTGLVRDAGSPVSGVEVAVSAGPAEGLSTITGENGVYRLYGVFADAEIRVRRPGYEEQKKRIVVTAHQGLNFDLALSSPRDQVSGTWTLAITAADECRLALPDELMPRRYTAVLKQDGVSQDGPVVTATLEGATFYASGNRTFNAFRGRVEPDRLTFNLASSSIYDDGYFPLSFRPGDVLEQLSAIPALLSVSGSVVLNASGSRRTGLLEGILATFSELPPPRLLQSCDSSRHRFELTR